MSTVLTKNNFCFTCAQILMRMSIFLVHRWWNTFLEITIVNNYWRSLLCNGHTDYYNPIKYTVPKVTSPRSRSWNVADPGIKPDSLCPEPMPFTTALHCSGVLTATQSWRRYEDLMACDISDTAVWWGQSLGPKAFLIQCLKRGP